MKPIVSICIPVYNVEKYIQQCIDSILSQTFQDFEIIVVNDASPDGSMNIVKMLASKDSRIRIYNNSENMGLMWTRKEGYIRAKGDYIIFLDSDDTLPPDSLNNLYSAIKDSDSDVVCGQIAYITSNGVSLDKYPNKLLYGHDSKSAIKSTLRWEITHNLCGKIYKRNVLLSHSYDTYKDVVNAEDAILFYQLLKNIHKITTITVVVYNYYLYNNSSTNVVLGEKALKGIFLWQKHRYDIVCNYYPSLLNELYTSMTAFLTSLAPSLMSKQSINQYLLDYGIPFEIGLLNILKHLRRGAVLRALLSYYCSSIVKIYRYHKLKHGGVK